MKYAYEATASLYRALYYVYQSGGRFNFCRETTYLCNSSPCISRLAGNDPYEHCGKQCYSSRDKCRGGVEKDHKRIAGIREKRKALLWLYGSVSWVSTNR